MKKRSFSMARQAGTLLLAGFGLYLNCGAVAAQDENKATAIDAPPSEVALPAAARPLLGLQIQTFVLINDIMAGSAAEQAGLQKSDIIVKLNGNEINDAAEFGRRIQVDYVGKALTLLVFRNGKPLVVSVPPLAVEAAATALTQAIAPQINTKPRLGVQVQPVVIAEGVAGGSAAERAGLQEFDRIVKLDGASIKDATLFVNAVRAVPPDKPLALVIRRGEKEMTVTVPKLTVIDATAPDKVMALRHAVVHNRISADVAPSEELFKKVTQLAYDAVSNTFATAPQKVTVTFDTFKVRQPLANLVETPAGETYRRDAYTADDSLLYPIRTTLTITETYADNQTIQYKGYAQFSISIGVHRKDSKGFWATRQLPE